jgi:hypothetical protein
MTLFLAVVAVVFLVGTVVFLVFSPTPGTLPLPLTLGVLLCFLALEWLPAFGIAVAFVVGRRRARWAVLDLPYREIFFIRGGAEVEVCRLLCWRGLSPKPFQR